MPLEGVMRKVAAGGAPTRLAVKVLVELGVDRAMAEIVAVEQPSDVERWAGLREIPPEEMPT